MTKDYSQQCETCETRPTVWLRYSDRVICSVCQEPMPEVSPIVKELYALMEKHYGDPTGFKKLRYTKKDFNDVFAATKIIWGALAAKGIQWDAAIKLDMNRNTIRKHCKQNPYLKPIKTSLFKTSDFDTSEVKSKLELDTQLQKV